MKIGMTAYATEQGLGYLAKSFYDAGVIDNVILIHHGKRETHPEWYDNRAIPITSFPIGNKPGIASMLDELDVMLFFETPFDWDFPDVCRAHNTKTICMPMYEWFPKARVNTFDLYLCPSLLDCDYFPGNPLFQPPVDPNTWKLRTTAKTFLHNAGNVGHRNHKGTLELLKSVEYIKSDLTLTIRTQDKSTFNKLLKQVPQVRDNPKVNLQLGAIPYAELFTSHDVLVAPEKFNGLSLPLQEAYAAGMLVITTDRYPACADAAHEMLSHSSIHEDGHPGTARDKVPDKVPYPRQEKHPFCAMDSNRARERGAPLHRSSRQCP